MTKKFVTTPIYYANGFPHIGHLLTTTIADATTRHYRLLLGEENVYFTTGLDEYGTSVETAAKKDGYTDFQKYVDERAEFWQKAFDETSISYDYFVRTTDPQHMKFAKDFIQKLIDADDVYKATYTGKYCYGCEKFLTLSDLNEEGICPNHRPDQVIEVEEENWYFKLSKYVPQLQKLIESDELKIYPQGKRNEVLARLKAGVDDQSISRPKEKVSWGVSFPGDDDQVVYVWIEALINYLSSLEINKNQDVWQNTSHLMAKDINWFHNVIWPAMLLSTGYELYKEAFVHSYLLVGGQKISKSLGNAISPKELIDAYGIEGTRYVVLANTPYKDDVDVTLKALTTKYNADLANGLGNLVSRVSKLGEGLEIENNTSESEYAAVINKHPDLIRAYEEYRFHDVIDYLRVLIERVNVYLNEQEPWKKEWEARESVIVDSIIRIKEVAVLIAPVLPETSKKIQAVFSGEVKSGVQLFQRV